MKKLITLCIIVLLLGCASTERVISDFDDTVNFDNYSTFVICLEDLFVENTNYPNYDNNEVRQLIGDAVETHMKLKGHKTNVLNPQLQAGFQIIVEEKEATFTNCELQGEYNYWHECTIDTVVYTEETLVVYVSDFKKNQIVWQASIQCDLNRSKGRLPSYINELVSTVFKEYPR